MDQNNPNSGSSGSGFNTGTSGGSGTPGTSGMSGATGISGSGGTSSSMGGGGTNIGGGGFGVTSASESGGLGTSTGTCAHCGQPLNRNAGLDQFLGKLGINEDMINNLKSQFQNVDIDEYLNTARDYLKDGGTKAGAFAKENPGKIAAGVAALALGAGLIYASTHRDR